MKTKKRITIIAAVAVMLVTTSPLLAEYDNYDTEVWTGWFTNGTLIYNSHNYYYSGTGGGTIDTVNSSQTTDYFYITAYPNPVPFVYSATNDTIWFALTDFDGQKTHGYSTYYDGNGTWEATATRTAPDPDQVFDLEGTWDTNDNDGTHYFDYTSTPKPTYDADWDVTDCTPSGITGYGESNGERYSAE